MSSQKKNKLRLAGAFAALATLALAVSCTGFFQNPTVSTITIDPPSPTISIGASTQMTAAATYSDGSTGTLSGGTSCTGNTVCWSSSDPSVASISTGGLLTGVSQGTTTITAASGAVTGTATGTVTLGDVTNLTVTPTSLTMTVSETSTTGLYAYATVGGQQVDVSSTVTWVSNNTTYVTVENGEDPEYVESGATAGSTTVYCTYVSGTTTLTSNTVTVNVSN